MLTNGLGEFKTSVSMSQFFFNNFDISVHKNFVELHNKTVAGNKKQINFNKCVCKINTVQNVALRRINYV